MSLSFIELNKKNLIHNLKVFRSIAQKGTQFALAIKGNAYGHGQNEIAQIAEPYADYFLVNSVEELIGLRMVSKKPVLLLGYVNADEYQQIFKLKAIPAIFSVTALRNLNRAAQKVKRIQEIHVACDALLGREGLLFSELPRFFATARKMKHVRITGMYAHFANIEDTTNFSHAQKQVDEYEAMLTCAASYGYTNLLTHISATSGLLTYEKGVHKHSIIRLGIGMYGLWPSEALKKAGEKNGIILKPVLTWKSQVALVKQLPKGRTIGYGLTYTTKRVMRVALIPQGYADGLTRIQSNNGCVLIHGRRAPILGRVSMNMIIVGVDAISEIQEGDEVVLLGKQKNDEITAEEIAEATGTINYEITTRISSLLPRIIR